MKLKPAFIITCLTAISLLSACTGPSSPVRDGGVPTQEAVIPTQPLVNQKPIVGIVTETECFTGPGIGYDPVGVLAPGIYFEIVAIDDDIAWFQIDPTAIIDPTPPSGPRDELSGQPEIRLRCWVPGSGVDINGDLSAVPVVEMPVVALLESAACRQGATGENDVEWFLDAGAFFRVVGIGGSVSWIDDDITWIDDDITWIDDDITWFQIDPTAIIDPMPPSRPLDESSGQPEMRLRCWVPGTSVDFRGDLSQVPVLPIPVALLSAGGIVDIQYTSSVEIEAVCSAILPDQAAVRVSHTPATRDVPTITVDGDHFGLCHTPETGVLECLPLHGAVGSTHGVRACYPGESCEDWTVTVPACPEPSVREVLPACSSIIEGSPSVQVRLAPGIRNDVQVTVDGDFFYFCHAPEAGVKECLTLPGEAGSTTTVRTCVTGEACQSWSVTVPDCSPEAEVEVAPICDFGYAAVRVAFTPITLDPPRITAEGGGFGICHTPERGVLHCLVLPGEAGSIASVRTCFSGGGCDDWQVTVPNCEEEEPSEGRFLLAGAGCHDEKSIFFILDTQMTWLVPRAAFTYTVNDGETTYSCSVHPTIAGRLYCSGTRPGSPGALEVCIQQDGTPSPICHTLSDWPAQENAIPNCAPTQAPSGLPPCSSYGPNNCPSDRCHPEGPYCVPNP